MSFSLASQCYAQSINPDEQMLWESVKETDDPLSVQMYLDIYPQGVFSEQARSLLQPKQVVPAPDYSDEILGGDDAPKHKVPAPAPQQLASPELCDQYTEHPQDAGRVGTGIAFDLVQQSSDAAINACLPLAQNEALDPRGKYAFQLSRAYLAADQYEERLQWLDIAAQRGWVRAHFRRALLANDDETSSTAELQRAVSDFVIAGQDYPGAYLDAARVLWNKLEGYDQNREQIYDLVQRAYQRDVGDSHYYLALIAIRGDHDLSNHDLFFHLSKMIERDHKADWAKRYIARRIGYVYGDGLTGLVEAFRHLTREEFPAGSDSYEFVERNKKQFILWAHDAVINAPEDKLSYEKRSEIVLQTLAMVIQMYIQDPIPENAEIFVTTHSLLCAVAEAMGADPAEVESICLRMIDTAFDVIDDTIRAQARERDFAAEITTLTNHPEIDTLTHCLTNKKTNWDGKRIKVTGYNQCSIPLQLHIRTWAEDYGKDRTYDEMTRIDGHERFTLIRPIYDTRLKNYDGRMRISYTACHTFFDPKEIREHIASGEYTDSGCPIYEPGSFFPKLTSFQNYQSAMLDLENAMNGKSGNDIGIRPEHCVLVVASRETLAEVQAYIDAFQNTEQWNWKVFEAANGWFAISSSLVEKDKSDQALNQLKSEGKIPSDSFCSSGKSFVRRVM